MTASTHLNLRFALEKRAIAGESGRGGNRKTAFLALMGLLATNGRIGGSGRPLTDVKFNLPERESEYAKSAEQIDDFSGPDDLVKSL